MCRGPPGHMGGARISHAKAAPVAGNRKAVRLHEIGRDSIRGTGPGIRPVQMAGANLALRARILAIGKNAVVRTGEPDSSVGSNRYVVRKVQLTPVPSIRDRRPQSVMLGADHASRSMLASRQPPRTSTALPEG